MAHLLADYVNTFPQRVNADDEHAAMRVVIDSLAVAIGGLRSQAAVAARRFARSVGADGAARVWGTRSSTTPEIAALANGVSLRAYDYNDLYIGRGDAGHPSDMVPAAIAVAESENASGHDLLAALSLGYDITIALLESCTIAPAWDYPNLVGLGATCALARLFKLTPEQTTEALGITVTSHAASGELESGDLNRTGDLTMWKRFNGSDAMRQSVYACLLARAGVEGPVRPFSGTYGFLRLLCRNDGAFEELCRQLTPGRSRIGDSTFKRWPVGSRAQSAVQAALQARDRIADPSEIREVRVATNPATFHHLVTVRDDPWNPISRETADHSLPYIVGAAVLDGRLDVASFEPATVLNPARGDFIRNRVRIEPSIEAAAGDTTYPSSVRIETTGGRRSEGVAAAPPGHHLRPFDDEAIEQKFLDCSAALLRAPAARSALDLLWTIGEQASVRDAAHFLGFAMPDDPSFGGEPS